MTLHEAANDAGVDGWVTREGWPLGDAMHLGATTSAVYDADGDLYDDSSLGLNDIIAADWRPVPTPPYMDPEMHREPENEMDR